jgi:UDP-glucose 4-epimerase
VDRPRRELPWQSGAFRGAPRGEPRRAAGVCRLAAAVRAAARRPGENQAPEPLCLHAIHKSTVESYLRLYKTLFGLRYTIARVTNPYGPGQPPGRTAYGVVNRMIHLALGDRTLPVYGDGAQRRDYIYVDDLVNALIRLATSPTGVGRAYNVGSGRGTPRRTWRTIVDLAGGGRVEHAEWPALAAQVETGDFVPDITRICREIGWVPARCATASNGPSRSSGRMANGETRQGACALPRTRVHGGRRGRDGC